MLSYVVFTSYATNLVIRFCCFICLSLCFYFLGTRIIYDRNFLLQMRNSPVARTPPKNLPVIPGVTCDSPHKEKSKLLNGQKHATVHKPTELPAVEVEKGNSIYLIHTL